MSLPRKFALLNSPQRTIPPLFSPARILGLWESVSLLESFHGKVQDTPWDEIIGVLQGYGAMSEPTPELRDAFLKRLPKSYEESVAAWRRFQHPV